MRKDKNFPSSHRETNVNKLENPVPVQLNQAELSIVQVKTQAERVMDLSITLIDDTTVRMPYAAAHLAISAVNTPIVRMPYAAGRMSLQATKTVISIG